jgi:hypothetical protein
MLTWRIHRTLDDPLKRDPISWRGYEARFGKFIPVPAPRLPRVKRVYSAALMIVLSPLIGVLLLAFFFPAPILALLASSLFGWRLVERLSGAVGGEHTRRTYELLCALPFGKMGAHWVYAAQWFGSTRSTRLLLRGALVSGLLAAPFLFGGWAYPLTGQRAVEFWFADTLAFWAFLIYDYFNTRVIAVLIAMLTPALTPKPRTITALSVGMYLLILLESYLLAAGCALVVLPRLLLWLHAPHVAYILIAPLTAAAVIASRELITRWLWRWLGYATQTARVELDLLIR